MLFCVSGTCFESDWDALIGDIIVVSCCTVCFVAQKWCFYIV